jgi:hypothetical protein
MALISGRPISFKMNLYDALFVQRPVVEPELFASLRPPTYSGGLVAADDAKPMAAPAGKLDARGLGRRRTGAGGEMSYDKEGKDSDGTHALKSTLGLAAGDRAGGYVEEERLNLGQSVASAASASKLGDYFQYAIDHAVTLPRQKSALLPIVGKDVEGQRVSIYSEGTHPKFPLLGLVFKNTTGMHLTQGPITVFEGSTYAGDARIQDLQKGERRLLSYAIDLGTEVQAVPHSDNGKLTSVKIVKGIAYTKTKVKEQKTYTIANRNDTERVVMIEHPHRTDFTLTTKEKPWETAADVHRFKVTVAAGKTEPYTVSEEKDIASSIALTNSDDQFIRVVINDQVTSAAVKEALKRALELRGKTAATQREIQQQQQQLNVITTDQARLRQNLREMPPTAAAYKRYLQKFDDQETQIEKYQADIKKLQDEEHAQRKEFESYLANLNVE